MGSDLLYEKLPVIEITELEYALKKKYGRNILKNYDLAEVLFGTEYINDSCKYFFFDEIEEYKNLNWQNKEKLHIQNCVKLLLQNILLCQNISFRICNTK